MEKIPLYFLIVMLSINYIFALNQVKKCENYKRFIKNINDKGDMSLCKLFTANHNINNDINKNSEIKYVNLLNDNQINIIEFNTKDIFTNTKDIFTNHNEFFNSLDKKERDQIDKDYGSFKIKEQKEQKDERNSYYNYMNNIAKLNLKNKYKKEKDMYKLFRQK